MSGDRPSDGSVDRGRTGAAARVAALLGAEPVSLRPLSGGCVAEVYRVAMPDGADLVAKLDRGADPKLDREGFMLRRLEGAGVPVPRVIACERDALVMTHVENDGHSSAEGEAALGELVAALHEHGGERYGLERDTLIGPLEQPNAWDDDWRRFFAERRILPMADAAERRGALPAGTRGRLARLCERLDRLIPEPNPPSLVQGDLWSGNVLWRGGRPAALIDPAVYYADAEVELAFIDLMGGVGPAFWDAYAARRPIEPGFRAVRRDLYTLYPLLVHAVLFGGGYGASVEAVARRLA